MSSRWVESNCSSPPSASDAAPTMTIVMVIELYFKSFPRGKNPTQTGGECDPVINVQFAGTDDNWKPRLASFLPVLQYGSYLISL
jgi:hypothetical protein